MYKFMRLLIVLALVTFSMNAYAVEPFLNTQLLEASSRGETKTVKDAILNGAQVDARDRLGNTPLILACDAGYQEIVRILLENKASVNAVNKFGYTPLMSAVTNSHRYIVSLLIKAGADPKLPNKFGTTPEMYIRAQGFFTMDEYIRGDKPAISTQVDDRPSRRGAMAGIHSAPWREEFNQLISLGKTNEASELLIGYANTGNFEASYLLGSLFLSKGNMEQGIFWLKKAAASNDDMMKYRAAKSIIDNAGGLGIKDAVSMLKQSISKGNNFAKTEYAKLLLFGNGVPKDNANAYALFKDAADHEVPEAIYYKGLLQFIGRGTVQNEDKGVADIQLAADLGYKEAESFITKLNARKHMDILVKSKVADRSTVKAYLISMGAPINIDNPSCDVYTLGNAWDNAYGISSIEMNYPGDGTVKTTFIISGRLDEGELKYLENTFSTALFKMEGDNKIEMIDTFIPTLEGVAPKNNKKEVDFDKPVTIDMKDDKKTSENINAADNKTLENVNQTDKKKENKSAISNADNKTM